MRQKKILLEAQPSYIKLSRKREIDSVSRLEREAERNQERTGIANCIFNFKTKTEVSDWQKNPREESKLMKKYIQTRSKEKQMAVLKGTTPFQSRKMIEKTNTTKTLTKILEKNKMQEKLKGSQKNWLVVKELGGGRCRQIQQKTSENIRQTDTTLKEDLNGSNHMLKISQSHIFDEQKRLINSWVFKNKHIEFKNKNDLQKGTLKNTKMTLKQLWKAKFQVGIEEGIKNEVISLKSKSREKITYVGHKMKPKKEKKEEIFSKQTSIHSKHKPKTQSYYNYPSEISSSVLKVQPCKFEIPTSNLNFQARNKSICWSSSEPKIQLRESQPKLTPKPKANFSCKKIKTEECHTKQVSGWQYVNDFSEREQFF